MTRGITADGTVHGTTEDGTTLGITDMQDGTADGIRSGRDITLAVIQDTTMVTMPTSGEARDIRQDPTGALPAGQPAEAEWAHLRHRVAT